MTPVSQTIFGEGGNCFQACLATIFDLPLEDCPHIFEGCKAGDKFTLEKWDRVREFAAAHNHHALWLDPEDTEGLGFLELITRMDLPYIAIGLSGTTLASAFVRGFTLTFLIDDEGRAPTRVLEEPTRLNHLNHCVVMQGGRNVHDPNGTTFLDGPPVLYIAFLDCSRWGLYVTTDQYTYQYSPTPEKQIV